jgi:hypothetical protein
MIKYFFRATVETGRRVSVIGSHSHSAVCVSGATYDLTRTQHMRWAASLRDRGCIDPIRTVATDWRNAR